ncbi:MAG TPA: hypothetical protein VGF55_08655 [Gemmataceae bacterium]
MRRPAFPFVGALLTAGCGGLIGCFELAPKPPAQPQPAAAPVPVDQLAFEDPKHRQRFFAFDKAVREFAGPGFDHRDYRRGGSFVRAAWAKGVALDPWLTLRGRPPADVYRLEVDTIVVGGRAKSAALTVETVRADPAQWSVYLYYREAAEQNVTEPWWSIKFFRWDPSKLGVMPFRPDEYVQERLDVPVRSYDVRDSRVELPPDARVKEGFLRYVRSADALRDAYLADLAELERRAVALIDEHRGKKRVIVRYRGSIPPETRLDSLTADEERDARALAKVHFAKQAQFMRDRHRVLYAALRKAFPLEKCWEELEAKGHSSNQQ